MKCRDKKELALVAGGIIFGAKQNLTKLSRMEPEQQEAAAKQLAEGKIKSADEYAAKETPAAADEDNYWSSRSRSTPPS